MDDFKFSDNCWLPPGGADVPIKSEMSAKFLELCALWNVQQLISQPTKSYMCLDLLRVRNLKTQ